MFDEAADQAATQAAAMVINHLSAALKQALKALFAEYRREFIEYILREKWIRIVLGLLTILGLLGILIKEYL